MMNWILAGLFSILLFEPAYSLVYREKTGDFVIYSALWTTNGGGGVPTAAISGRNVIQIICKREKKSFVTKIP